MSEELWASMEYILPAFTSGNQAFIIERQEANQDYQTLTSLEAQVYQAIQ